MTETARSMDVVLPFTLGGGAFRGRLVRLHVAANDALKRQDVPEVVGKLMGESMSLAAVLGASLKFDGLITVQTASDGCVSRVVADMTSDGGVRASAAVDKDRIQNVLSRDDAPDIGQLLGCGHLALTVDQGEHTERYQGVVALKGATLADTAIEYFRQSEQIETELLLASCPPGDGFGWRAGGLLLQRLPSSDVHLSQEDEQDAWETASVLLKSLTSAELLDPTLSAETLLLRLYHALECRVYEHSDVRFFCRCSRERLQGILEGLPEDDLAHSEDENGKIQITCDFCKEVYDFDAKALRAHKTS